MALVYLSLPKVLIRQWSCQGQNGGQLSLYWFSGLKKIASTGLPKALPCKSQFQPSCSCISFLIGKLQWYPFYPRLLLSVSSALALGARFSSLQFWTVSFRKATWADLAFAKPNQGPVLGPLRLLGVLHFHRDRVYGW